MMRADQSLSLAFLALLIASVVSPTAYADLIDEDEPIISAPAPAPQVAAPEASLPSTPKTPKSANVPPKPANASPTSTKTKTAGSTSSSRGADDAVLSPTGTKLGATGPAADDSKQPVHFESKGLRALKENGTAELLQDVIVTQGTLRLEADKAKIYYDDDVKDVVRVLAEGNIRIFKVDEESGEKIKAFGDRAEFDNKARTVVLDGNARLWRGDDLVRGKKIMYELDSGWIRADSVAGEVRPPEDKK